MDPPVARILALKGATLTFANEQAWLLSGARMGQFLRTSKTASHARTMALIRPSPRQTLSLSRRPTVHGPRLATSNRLCDGDAEPARAKGARTTANGAASVCARRGRRRSFGKRPARPLHRPIACVYRWKTKREGGKRWGKLDRALTHETPRTHTHTLITGFADRDGPQGRHMGQQQTTHPHGRGSTRPC